jgi:hypothetical protein
MLSKDPPWYVKLLLVVGVGFLASVAAWSFVAVLGWVAFPLSGL